MQFKLKVFAFFVLTYIASGAAGGFVNTYILGNYVSSESYIGMFLFMIVPVLILYVVWEYYVRERSAKV